MVKKILNKKITPIWIYLYAWEKIIRKRLRKVRKISNGRWEIFRQMRKDFHPVRGLKNLIKIDNSKDYQKVIKEIEQKLFCF
jgi:dephospho-CoA kinase